MDTKLMFITFFAGIFIPGVLCCDQDALGRCMGPLNAVATELQLGIELPEGQLEQLCSNLNRTVRCAERVIKSCPEQMAELWGNIKSGFQYLCTEPGFSMYKEHSVCLEGEEVKQHTASCNKTFVEEQAALLTITDLVKLYRRSCRVYNNMMDCTTGGILTLCGKPAARFQLNLTSTLLQSSLTTIGCSIKIKIPKDDATEPPASSSTAPHVLLLLLAATTLITSCFVRL